jgi:uncharacterized protein (UPF0276 family)
VEASARDRVGLGWRPDIAAGIFAELHRIDVLEVIADDYVGTPKRRRKALGTLARQVPVMLHGVGLGLASATTVDQRRLDDIARLVNDVGPESWSEHLAFVRSGGLEIGHLTAPPRTPATIDGTARNVAHAWRTVGAPPHMENIATLLEPPASTLTEAEWLAAAVAAANCPLLLDIHNVYANAVNHGPRPADLLSALPLERVTMVHMAGGKWITDADGRSRLLDDHLHDVPDEAHVLLEELACRAYQPLTVILERDGEFPPIDALMAELDRIRATLQRGRRRRASGDSA